MFHSANNITRAVARSNLRAAPLTAHGAFYNESMAISVSLETICDNKRGNGMNHNRNSRGVTSAAQRAGGTRALLAWRYDAANKPTGDAAKNHVLSRSSEA